jgi:hypothetical protein
MHALSSGGFKHHHGQAQQRLHRGQSFARANFDPFKGANQRVGGVHYSL